MHFAGLDLGWKMNPPRQKGTGLCVMDADAKVREIGLLTDDEEIIELLSSHRRIWVGIDAPLFVPNQRGVRRCERLLLDEGIRLLPANREFMRRFGGCRGERIVGLLGQRGFSLFSDSDRAIFEVYPFGMLNVIIERVPRYKRGALRKRKEGALSVLKEACRWAAVPCPGDLAERIREASIREMAHIVDELDAFLSVLCVYAHWIYGGERTRMMGGREDGYILLPEEV